MFVVKNQNTIQYWFQTKIIIGKEFATFNLCPIKHNKKIYGLYRAISAPDVLQNPRQTSIIGVGKSKDGIHFENRVPFYCAQRRMG